MKLYSIYFTGYWPVGAVATVIATTPEEAVNRLLSHLQVNHPNLAADINCNNYEALLERCKQITEPVTILLDGQY